MIGLRKENELDGVIVDIKSGRLGLKEYSKKRVMEEEDNSKNKPEHNKRREEDERSEGINTCDVFVFQFWNLAWVTSRTSK